jgi:hypothetical protein
VAVQTLEKWLVVQLLVAGCLFKAGFLSLFARVVFQWLQVVLGFFQVRVLA